VMHWLRLREPGWQVKAMINGLGATVTLSALVIIAISKFTQGAWISILLIPLIVVTFLQIRSHYAKVGHQLTLHGLPPSLKPLPPPRIVVPVSGIHRGVIEAINFARSMTEHITAVSIEMEEGSGASIRKEWNEWLPDIRLVIVPSPYRSMVGPLLDYLDQTDQEHNDGQQAVLILPEFIAAHWWQAFLHNQSAWLIRAALLYRRRRSGYQRVIIEVPYHLRE
jgi:hypothetical protein